MDSTPGEVIQEGFLVKHCPNAIGPKALDNPWKPRYFLLKGHHLLYWKKKQHVQQSPNSPHCLVDLEGSTVERVSLVYAKPPPFQYCLCLTTGIVHKGAFLTYHLCTQDEDAFRLWFANLRKAAGQPEIPFAPSTKVHTRSLSTGGGLGVTQKQPLKNSANAISAPDESNSNRSALEVPSSSGHSRSLSQGVQLPGVLTERHFQAIKPDNDLSLEPETSINETSSEIVTTNTTDSSTTNAVNASIEDKKETPETTSIDTEGTTEAGPSPPPRKLAQASVGLKSMRSLLRQNSEEAKISESAPTINVSTNEEKDPVPTNEQTANVKEAPKEETKQSDTTQPDIQTKVSSSTPTPTQTSTQQTEATPQADASQLKSEAKPVARANSKQEEIQNEIARARQRVLELEKNNKLTPPSTVLSRGLSKTAATPIRPPPSTWSSIFTNRFAMLLVLLLIFYWYFF
eukprot:TRINITY_DN6929_c0_g1_i1.p1 TRINITY_DN6929_c0_g1~~TRINITY_DN6929_c0_g1_i1.p1  ORF type:complete len:458 (-),score=100.55 TRINITY_DN6929_c0_g1_i1:120-1493(-)